MAQVLCDIARYKTISMLLDEINFVGYYQIQNNDFSTFG